MIEDLARFIAVARGERPADLVVKGARIFQSFTGEFVWGDIAIDQGYIAGLGSYIGRDTIEAEGRYALPGFIDGHIHIESSLLSPAEFARLVVPLGTTTVIADPHEIANVAGVAGIRYMMRATERLPLDVFFMLPSCVPATPLEDSGARLTAADLFPLLDEPRVLGLAEVMNVPGVLNGDPEVCAKLTMRRGMNIDGHAPGLLGQELMAYAAAGIVADHECVTAEEAWARLAAGMFVAIREGSAARNFAALRPILNERTSPYCMLVTDDREPADILRRGHINSIVKMAVEADVPLAAAIHLATLNPARAFGLKDRGMLAPHRKADILLFGGGSWLPSMVIKNGALVALEGKLIVSMPEIGAEALCHTVNIAPLKISDLAVPVPSGRANVIGLVPRQLITERRVLPVLTEQGLAVADPEHDILKLAVIERHHGSGRVGTGLLQGYGLRRGAIASTVGHDSHNLIVVGANDADMMTAVAEIQRIQGGYVIVAEGEVLAALPLPIGGLMASEAARSVAEQGAWLAQTAHRLGVSEDCEPLQSLSFLSLPVIPALKITDRGLVDVVTGNFLPVDAGDAQ